MQIKKFDERWSVDEINEYVKSFNILILFEIFNVIKEAKIIIHGKDMNDKQKQKLKELIIVLFGGQVITDSLCIKINDFGVKWYNKFILKKLARVINFKKGKEK